MKHLLNLNLGVILQRHWQNPAPSLNPRITERISVHLKRFFCAHRFMVGCAEALRRAVFCSGRFNSVRPATLLLEPNGGSSQTYRGLYHV